MHLLIEDCQPQGFDPCDSCPPVIPYVPQTCPTICCGPSIEQGASCHMNHFQGGRPKKNLGSDDFWVILSSKFSGFQPGIPLKDWNWGKTPTDPPCGSMRCFLRAKKKFLGAETPPEVFFVRSQKNRLVSPVLLYLPWGPSRAWCHYYYEGSSLSRYPCPSTAEQNVLQGWSTVR